MITNTPRMDAAKTGNRIYKGKPCRQCTNMLRYTTTGGCIKCAKKRSVESREKIKNIIKENRGA